jgi:hypothetical protein
MDRAEAEVGPGGRPKRYRTVVRLVLVMLALGCEPAEPTASTSWGEPVEPSPIPLPNALPPLSDSDPLFVILARLATLNRTLARAEDLLASEQAYFDLFPTDSSEQRLRTAEELIRQLRFSRDSVLALWEYWYTPALPRGDADPGRSL